MQNSSLPDNQTDQTDQKPGIRRMVVFLAGYDPAGPERYYIMLRQQSRYYTRRFNIPLSLGKFTRNAKPTSHFSRCTLEAEWPEGNCEVLYRISDWQDKVLKDAGQPFWKRNARYLSLYPKLWLNGTFIRILKWQQKAAVVFSIPFFFLLARLFIILFVTWFFTISGSFINFPELINIIAGFIAGIAIVWRLESYFATFYESHLADSLNFKVSFPLEENTALDKEAAAFAGEIIKDIEETKPDEVILIGHSCGCFHSLLIHKALLLHQDRISTQKPPLLHMTIGSLLPFTITNRSEKLFRKLVVDLLNNPKTDFIEYFAPQDPFSVPFMDLTKDYKLPLSSTPPARYEVRSANFRQIFSQKKLRKFRWNPLRMHFQYLTANDKPGAYDYFRMITHPLSLRHRLNPVPQSNMSEE